MNTALVQDMYQEKVNVFETQIFQGLLQSWFDLVCLMVIIPVDSIACQSFDIVGGQLPDPIYSEDFIPKLGSNEQLLPLDDTLIDNFGESLPN